MELATYLTEQGDLRACKGREADFKSAQKTNPVSKRDEIMVSGIYRLADGRVMVDYGKRRGPISCAQYKANGYQPTYDKLGVKSLQGAKGEPRPARRARPTAQNISSEAPTENAARAHEH